MQDTDIMNQEITHFMNMFNKSLLQIFTGKMDLRADAEESVAEGVFRVAVQEMQALVCRYSEI